MFIILNNLGKRDVLAPTHSACGLTTLYSMSLLMEQKWSNRSDFDWM